MPMPGSPTIPTTCPRPPITCARTACSVASSCARPTKGLRARSSTWAPGDVLRAQPQDLVGAHGGRLPGHRHGRDLLQTDVPLDQAGRGLTAEQHAGRCVLLQRLDRQGEVPDDGGWPLGVPDPAQTIRPVCSPRHAVSGSSAGSPRRDAANRWCSPHAANRARRA